MKEDRRQQKKRSDKSAYAEENASMKALSEANSLKQDLTKQIKGLTKVTSGNTAMQQQQRPIRGRNVVYYGCGVLGHIVRDCPQKGNNGRNQHHNAPPGTLGDSAQGTGATSASTQPLN